MGHLLDQGNFWAKVSYIGSQGKVEQLSWTTNLVERLLFCVSFKFDFLCDLILGSFWLVGALLVYFLSLILSSVCASWGSISFFGS